MTRARRKREKHVQHVQRVLEHGHGNAVRAIYTTAMLSNGVLLGGVCPLCDAVVEHYIRWMCAECAYAHPPAKYRLWSKGSYLWPDDLSEGDSDLARYTTLVLRRAARLDARDDFVASRLRGRHALILARKRRRG